LASLGADARPLPLTRPVPPVDGGRALRAALDHLLHAGGPALDGTGGYEWLAVTSANGIRALADALAPAPGRDLAGGEGRVDDMIGSGAGGPIDDRTAAALPPLAVIGTATAEAAAAAGLAVTIVPDTATAADLAAALPPPERSARVLAPLAEAAGPDLQVGLEARGYTVDRVDAYRMAPVDPDTEVLAILAEADAVVVTAPSIVDALVDILVSSPGAPAGTGSTAPLGAPGSGPRMVCIGPRTAAQARVRGVEDPAVAPVHSADGIVEIVIDLLAEPQPTARSISREESP
jgi:uroporphyrinogen-III synthase